MSGIEYKSSARIGALGPTQGRLEYFSTQAEMTLQLALHGYGAALLCPKMLLRADFGLLVWPLPLLRKFRGFNPRLYSQNPQNIAKELAKY